MNSEKSISNLVLDEIKHVDEIDYTIKRKYDGHHIFKNIQFSDNGKEFNFTERVQALKINY
jgi:hypothetical protein